MTYEVDTLIKMGKSHSLHCEDDYLVVSNENFLLAAVFDGCSSGIDSHYASTKHKYIVRDVAEKVLNDWENQKQYYPDMVLRDIIFWSYQKIIEEEYVPDKEMLSTIVICFINKESREFAISFCGDGCCSINGENISVHDENGNAVWYLSSLKSYEYGNYFDYIFDYSRFYNGKLDGNSELAISTDGIESFMTKYGSHDEEFPKKVFFNTSELPEKYRSWKMERLYNVLAKGKLPDMENDGMGNIDDLTIIKIKCHD